MTERPIIFSGPMVRAILDGRKTQTRRVIRNVFRQPTEYCDSDCIKDLDGLPSRLDWAPENWELSPYGVAGDRLWVRETFRQAYPATSYSDGIVYRADKARALGMDEYSDRHRWKPSIHMPKKYARLWLEVTGVRVERLQDISEADVQAEGCTGSPFGTSGDALLFPALWDSLNAKRGHGWDTNPWVWVVEFRRDTDND